MKFVRTKNLEPGMISTKSIQDSSGVLMLAANHPITADIIQAMKRKGMAGVFIFDEFTQFEQFDSIVNDEFRQEAVNALRDFNIDKVIYLTNMIVEKIMSTKELVVDLHELSIYDQDTYDHSMNVCTLATTCGVGMGLDTDNLQQLALAAMLHDVGKRNIPLAILNKQGKLTPAEREIINEHPQMGYDLLYANQSISSYVRAAILSHHENYDGTGYPNHLAGEAIPLFARIIHIADVYDALTRKRSYKDKYMQSESLEFLMGNCGSMFDPDIVNTFLKYIVVYPVGCDVILSDGRIAHVIKNRSSSVTRPVVMTWDKEKLDLAKDPACRHITVIKELDFDGSSSEEMTEHEKAR
ncbi:MAG: HD-GYP domain-containing protein [Lachnospiraceae bacterium]|nr:HD-GYP domain-containing protein [Lachnospiraceae bacterium]